jgi:signal transduction histidine kinase
VVRDISLPPRNSATATPSTRLIGRWSGARAADGWRRDASAAARDRSWRSWTGWLDLAWAALWMLGMIGVVIFARWQVVPFYLIWISFALLYGFRIRRAKPTSWVLAAMVVTTFAAIAIDLARGAQPADELAEVPLMAALFLVTMWHADRRLAADAEHVCIGEENARQLATQRQFLQDVSHQLRTPITIALGHAELLARTLADSQEKRDIHVVVGELNRLRRLGERLLLIAASENPDFLCPEPVALEQLMMEVLRRWRPAAQRRWQLGQLDHAIVNADRERLGLAVDSLLENAVQHTSTDDLIRLSVVCSDHSEFARMIIEDSGSGIQQAALAHIFDRFATGSRPDGHQGTGLGLALVCAVMRGHGGDVLVQSAPHEGSRFELRLPVQAAADNERPGIPAAALSRSSPGDTGEPCGSASASRSGSGSGSGR